MITVVNAHHVYIIFLVEFQTKECLQNWCNDVDVHDGSRWNPSWLSRTVVEWIDVKMDRYNQQTVQLTAER